MPMDSDASIKPNDRRLIDVRRLGWNHYTWHVELGGFVWIGVGGRRHLRAMWNDALAELTR
jgi:hypothetical protein